MDPLESGKWLIERVRTLVGIFRNSPTELIAGTLAAFCFWAATLGLANEFVKPLVPPHLLEIIRYGLFALGGLLLAWAAFRIWKQAIPPALPAQETRPSAIKGPMPFSREDGELFRCLNRKANVEDLPREGARRPDSPRGGDGRIGRGQNVAVARGLV
jgi:hypothetical protein